MKIFISHSSAQKPFAEQLIEEIGRDVVTFDKYSFEPGELLTESIKKGIEACDIFVLLISQDSVASTWVREEIDYVAPLTVTKGIVFAPYRIDEQVKAKDPHLPDWVWNHLVTYYPYPKLLARTVQRVLRQQLWKKYPSIKTRDDLFVGRNNDMNQLEKRYYKEDLKRLRVLFISGFPFVGRKTMFKHFIHQYLKHESEAYSPVVIYLKPTDSVEQMTQQLNDHIGLISNDDLLLKMAEGSEEAMSWCIRLLHKLLEYNEKIIIEDDTCLVKPGGSIVEWFLDLVSQKSLPHEIIFYIASRYRPSSAFVDRQDTMLEMTLSTLHRDDMYNLFKECLRNVKKQLTDEDMDFFVDQFTGYPKQAIDTADYLERNSLLSAKKHVATLRASYDGNYSEVLEQLTDAGRNMLILLSKFDFISCDLLQEIYDGVDVSEQLDELNQYSLYETFGLSQQYLSLNHSVADYIMRTRQPLSADAKARLKTATKRVLSEMQKDLTDLSSSLFNIKENIRHNLAKMDERYLIPSFVLKVIVEEYHNEHDDAVVQIAEKLIRDYKKSNYESCMAAIHYWYCCSLSRKQDREAFNEQVAYFSDNAFDYYYLLGFYNRHHGKTARLKDARHYYEKALEERDNRQFTLTSVAKVEHELVIVLMKLKLYKEALAMARRNYENNQHNAYHIRAYFNCLVHTATANKDDLLSLIETMKNTKERGVALFVPTMKIQYDYYLKHDFSATTRAFRTLLESQGRGGRRYACEAFRDICRLHDAMSVYESIVKDDIGDDDDDEEEMP